MKTQRGYKTELDLNNKQRTACLKHAGVARFAYNWGLNQKNLAYKNGEKTPNAIKLHKRLNALKQIDFPWMYEVSKCAPQEALRNLDRAFINFFKKLAKFPKFKNKKNGIGSFRLTGTIRVSGTHVQLPRLGKLKLKEKGYIPTNAKILSATVSEHAGHWFVSIQVEQELPKYDDEKDEHDVIGVDLGISRLGTCSDGQKFENPKPLKRKLRKLSRLQRSLSRAKKGGKNRVKARRRVARLHYKVGNIRKDTLHKMTSKLAKTKRIIGIEDLNVAGMLRNHCLAFAIADVGFGECGIQMHYKGSWYDCQIVEADRFFPSSKRCHVCGLVNHSLTLNDREWLCEGCGTHHDRDENASYNLEYVAASSTETINALRSEKALA